MQFLNPERVLAAIPVEPEMTVADFGCGSGHYAVAAARLVGQKGQVWAYDVVEDALSQTATLGKLGGLSNISTRQCDLEKFGSCDLAEATADLVIMSGILHQITEPATVIREAYRVLKTGGRLLVVEWKKDSFLGPEVSYRIEPGVLQKLLESNGFRPVQASHGGSVPLDLPVGSFHYALIYTK